MKKTTKFLLVMSLSFILVGCNNQKSYIVPSQEQIPHEKGCNYDGTEKECSALHIDTKNLDSAKKVRGILASNNVNIVSEIKPKLHWTIYVGSQEKFLEFQNLSKNITYQIDLSPDKKEFQIIIPSEDQENIEKFRQLIAEYHLVVKNQSQTNYWSWFIRVTPDSKLFEVKKQLASISDVNVSFVGFAEAL